MKIIDINNAALQGNKMHTSIVDVLDTASIIAAIGSDPITSINFMESDIINIATATTGQNTPTTNLYQPNLSTTYRYYRITDGTAENVVEQLIKVRPELVMDLDDYLKLFNSTPHAAPNFNEYAMQQIKESDLPAYIPMNCYGLLPGKFTYIYVTNVNETISKLRTWLEQRNNKANAANVLGIFALISDVIKPGNRTTDYYVALDIGKHEILIRDHMADTSSVDDELLTAILEWDYDLWHESSFFIVEKDTDNYMSAADINELQVLLKCILAPVSVDTLPETQSQEAMPSPDLVPAPIAETEVTPLAPKAE